MSYLDAVNEQRLADMTDDEVTDLLARVRPPLESGDPMVRAAQALRRHRLGPARPGVSKEYAAARVREWGSGSRD